MPSYRQAKVGELVQREPAFIAPEETLRAVAHAMWVEDVGALVIGDGQRTVGIISERDLIRQIGQGADPDAVTAAEAGTPHLIAAKPWDSLDEAAYQMLEDAIRHVPVVDGDDRVVGMISVRDLLRPLLSEGSPDTGGSPGPG